MSSTLECSMVKDRESSLIELVVFASRMVGDGHVPSGEKKKSVKPQAQVHRSSKGEKNWPCEITLAT